MTKIAIFYKNIDFYVFCISFIRTYLIMLLLIYELDHLLINNSFKNQEINN